MRRRQDVEHVGHDDGGGVGTVVGDGGRSGAGGVGQNLHGGGQVVEIGLGAGIVADAGNGLKDGLDDRRGGCAGPPFTRLRTLERIWETVAPPPLAPVTEVAPVTEAPALEFPIAM